MADEEIPSAAAEVEPTSPVPSDHKRKLDVLESDEAPKSAISSPPPDETLAEEPKEPSADSNGVKNPMTEEEEVADEISDVPEAKRPRLEEEIDDSAAGSGQQEVQKVEVPQTGDPHHLPTENVQQAAIDVPPQGNLTSENNQQPASGVPQQVDLPVDNTPQPASVIIQQENLPPLEQPDLQTLSRKVEVPNNKVGVLIGKAGETIKFLQYNSGARIQITRDTDADPQSSTRPVELIGTLENINKAEQLIKDVIAEADAGGSPALVARGFGTPQTGAEQIQIQVPYEKVGLIIGKGGETIKNLQTKSGARIQVILQNIPEGDASKERTVRITGNKQQIETAREMIKEVMNQNPVRPSPLSGGFSQSAHRSRGPAGPPQWGPRVPPPAQPTSYGYSQGGTHPSQTPQYPPQTYSGYPQQQAPRSSINAGWDQRSSAPVQTTPQSGAYVTDGPASVAHIPTASATAPSPAPAPAPTQTNYNYGQAQGYGQPTSYPQSVPAQQSYGPAPTQHAYGGHGNSQPGAYPQQFSTEPGYMQQPYSKPAYGMPSQGPPPQSYGPPPRASQPGDVPYQGHVPSAQPYGPQQSYPYASNGPSQQSYPYGPTPATHDGYNQPLAVTAPTPGYAPQGGPVAPGYTQQGGQVPPGYAQQGQPAPGYAQQTGQPAPVYAQHGGHSGGYGQYPLSQPGYGDQPAPNNASGGYQGPIDASYNSVPGQAYGASVTGQVGYVQPPSNQSSYEQPMPQPGYGGHAGTVPVGYGKSLSPQPQPGYGQYESGQMYGHH